MLTFPEMLDLFPMLCETLWNINSGARMTCQGCCPNLRSVGLLFPIAGGRSKLCGTNKLELVYGEPWKNCQMIQERETVIGGLADWSQRKRQK